MTVHYCSLHLDQPQSIPADGYHTVRFPFGTAESWDEHRMHQVKQPDGHTITDWRTDDRAGLIWPAVDGLGILTAMVRWESGTYRQYGARFVRDPLTLTTGWDATATDERAPTPGDQRATYTWQLIVHPGTPLALQVHNGSTKPRRLLFAEFKLSIHPLKEA